MADPTPSVAFVDRRRGPPSVIIDARDLEHPNWKELGGAELKIWLVLSRACRNDSGSWCLSRELLAERCGMSKPTVDRATKELERWGFAKRVSRFLPALRPDGQFIRDGLGQYVPGCQATNLYELRSPCEDYGDGGRDVVEIVTHLDPRKADVLARYLVDPAQMGIPFIKARQQPRQAPEKPQREAGPEAAPGYRAELERLAAEGDYRARIGLEGQAAADEWLREGTEGGASNLRPPPGLSPEAPPGLSPEAHTGSDFRPDRGKQDVGYPHPPTVRSSRAPLPVGLVEATARALATLARGPLGLRVYAEAARTPPAPTISGPVLDLLKARQKAAFQDGDSGPPPYTGPLRLVDVLRAMNEAAEAYDGGAHA